MTQDNAVYDPKVHETVEVTKGGSRKRVYAARVADYEALGWKAAKPLTAKEEAAEEKAEAKADAKEAAKAHEAHGKGKP